MSDPAVVEGLVVAPAGSARPVIDGVGFRVGPGEVLGIAGRSGSGKTTAALALLGHLRPGLVRRAGAVRVGGVDPFGPAGARRVRGRIATYLGQDRAAALNPRRRLGAQVAEAVRLRSPGIDVPRAVGRLLESLALPADPAFQRRFPDQVSGGQARRVALAVALAGNPALVVLDEPTAGLDTVVAAAVRDLLAGVVDRCAVVLVSHDPHLLAALAPRVLLLREGRAVADGPPAEVLALAPPPARAAASGKRPDLLEVRGLDAAHGRTR